MGIFVDSNLSLMKNEVLVVVVTYNAMKWADLCFLSLRNSSVHSDVYVVDNGSTDGTQDYIKKNFPEVIFFHYVVNLGFGRANNIGLEYALKNNYNYVYLLNQDAWVSTDTFDVLIKIQKANPRFGIISPLQRNKSHRFDDNFYKSTLSNECIFDRLFSDRAKDLYEVKFVMAAHWLISRECLIKVGGFSPSFPHYGEDDNYIDRCVYHGFKVGVTFNTMAVHDRDNRSFSLSKFLYMQYISNIRAFSNPNKESPSLFSLFYNTFKIALKAKSFKPFYYWFMIIRCKKEIDRNRELSKKDKAFTAG